jgi:hypothetical protein
MWTALERRQDPAARRIPRDAPEADVTHSRIDHLG